MDAWRYEIYLLVFKLDISLVRCAHSWHIELEHYKINFISPRAHVIFSIYFTALHLHCILQCNQVSTMQTEISEVMILTWKFSCANLENKRSSMCFGSSPKGHTNWMTSLVSVLRLFSYGTSQSADDTATLIMACWAHEHSVQRSYPLGVRRPQPVRQGFRGGWRPSWLVCPTPNHRPHLVSTGEVWGGIVTHLCLCGCLGNSRHRLGLAILLVIARLEKTRVVIIMFYVVAMATWLRMTSPSAQHAKIVQSDKESPLLKKRLKQSQTTRGRSYGLFIVVRHCLCPMSTWKTFLTLLTLEST